MKEYIREKLLSMWEEKYGDFCAKLMPTVPRNTVIGVRTPLLRAFARSLCDYDDFLCDLPHKYFEENNLHAFLIEREKDFDLCIEKLERFLPYIDNWATCDQLKPKCLKKEPQKLMAYVNKWLKSNDTYIVRFAVNMLMSFYLDENFKSEYLYLVANVKSDEYYINMARAWYFQVALVKQPQNTLPILENRLLDKWTHNKAIQKALESFRISKEQKDYLKTLKHKNARNENESNSCSAPIFCRRNSR